MKHSNAGFTLLEVLVALVVLAMALGAVVQAAADFTINQAYLRDRTFAEWVARNQLATVQLSGRWPSIGQQKGEVEFPLGSPGSGGREWRWVMQVTQTPEADLRRLDIEISPLSADEDESPLAVLSGFMEKPP
jgi:general secretion pathway protein I